MLQEIQPYQQFQRTMDFLDLSRDVLLQQPPTRNPLEVVTGLGVLHEISKDFPRLLDVSVRLLHALASHSIKQTRCQTQQTTVLMKTKGLSQAEEVSLNDKVGQWCVNGW